jgi:hypothetical protein
MKSKLSLAAPLAALLLLLAGLVYALPDLRVVTDTHQHELKNEFNREQYRALVDAFDDVENWFTDGTQDLNVGDVTAAGTVSAEQLTSTDDATVADDLLVEGDGDVNGTLTATTLTVTGTVSAEQLTSTDDLRVENDALIFGAVDVAGNLSASDITAVGDLTVWPDMTGGNAGAKNEMIGLPRITFVELLTGTNGTTETAGYIDTTPTGEWAEVDAGGNITVTADTTIYRHTANSLKLAFTAVITAEGVDGTIAQDDLSGNESLGFWIYSTEALTAGDFVVTLDDTDGEDQGYDVPAMSAEVWTWIELDISGCDANCNTVDGVQFLATEQGAASLTAVDVYLDGMYKWDADDEEDLGLSIVQDGVINVLTIPTAAGTANTWGVAVENVDFFVNYADGADGIVWITDQSTVQALAFVAY